MLEVGPNVPNTIKPGGLVVSTVRRPGSSLYDQIGLQDFTTDDVYYERGINLLHGYLTERYVEDSAYVVPLPESLREVGVLLEPTTIAEKGINQAFEIQRRIKVWRPRRAAVLGSGTIGLLASLVLRLRGLEVVCCSLQKAPYLNSDLIEELGGTYVSSQDLTLAQAAERHGPFDLMFEATGFSPLAFEAAEALGKNGVLVLASVTGGDRKAEVPTDRINQGFVLGNKVMVGTVNASRDDFERGVDGPDPGRGGLSRLARQAPDDARARARPLPGDDRAPRAGRRNQGLRAGEGGSLMEHYDLIVLGSGSAARDAAAKAVSKYGAKVALAETTRWGGSCPNVACKPTKAYLVVAELVHDINELAGKLGIEVGPAKIDLARVKARKDSLKKPQPKWVEDLSSAGFETYEGEATLVDAHTVRVGEQELTAERILIATGLTHRRPTDRRDRGDRLGRPRLRARVDRASGVAARRRRGPRRSRVRPDLRPVRLTCDARPVA